MKNVVLRMWNEDDGVLSFEWVLLVTLLPIGIVSGVAGARDAIIDELGDVAQAMLALDQSYTIEFPLEVIVHAPTTSSASESPGTVGAGSDGTGITGVSGAGLSGRCGSSSSYNPVAENSKMRASPPAVTKSNS